MDDNVKFTLLLDLYGPLLTQKQRRMLSLRVEEDLSLSEIAQMEAVSRQAVSELIVKAENALIRYEEKLGFLAREENRNKRLEQILSLLEEGKDKEAGQKLSSYLEEDRRA
ncbi:MAG: hypothetical protein II781_01215 [Clostridia bacterium]|nr:hypothetical protein [Clostridia bacterium]